MTERWTTADVPDQHGRVALITGGMGGLGGEVVRALTERGAHVLAPGRAELDLADLDSVRAYATRLRAAHDRIDVLVNNAGIMSPPRTLSPQGNELQFAVNHLGHFALTGLLLDRVAGRVVTVSSILHKRGRIDFDDLTGERDYSANGFYDRSKLANALFGLELHRRLTAAGSPVAGLLAHPGYAVTNLQARVQPGLYRTVLTRIGNPLIAQPAARGALPILYAATSPAARGGQFIGPGGMGELRGFPAVVRPAPNATDRETAQRLWAVSEELTGVSFNLPAAV